MILPNHLLCWIDLDQRLVRMWQGPAGGGLLVQACTDGQNQVRLSHRIARVVAGTAQVSQVVSVIVGEGGQAAIRGHHRHLEFFGEGDEFLPCSGVLGARSSDNDRVLGRSEPLQHLLDQGWLRVSPDHWIRLDQWHVGGLVQHIPRQ